MIKNLYKQILPEKLRNNIKLFKQRIIYPFYLGDKYYCNCCNKTFRTFLAFGNIKRPNARCPYCFSLERTRVLDLYLDKEIKLYEKTGIKLLHFAPEACLYKKISLLDIEYIDGDIHPAYAKHVIDITNINYENNYFDIIICSHVLGHVPNEEKAISEMFRVLKNDGSAILMTLIDKNRDTFEDKSIVSPDDRLKYYGEPNLVRLHGRDFESRLEQQGFNVQRINYAENLPKELLSKSSLGDGQRELIFLCKKPN